jgi:NAD(P)-dependent dehydrogenase (short-subunit alcohol dehydrogenase family)
MTNVKTYLVAGGLGLIGWQVSLLLIEAGYNIIIVDKNPNKSHEQNKVIESSSNKISVLTANGNDSNIISDYLNDYTKSVGEVHGIVNLLAFYEDREKQMLPIEDYLDEVWEAAVDVNVNQVYKITKTLLKYFIANKIQASFVFISSIYGIRGPDNRIYEGGEYLGVQMRTPAHYAFAKAGVLGFSRLISTEYGHLNIRSNCVTPGGVFSGQNEAFVEKYSSRVPLQRMAHAPEVAEAITFLLTPKSSYITGQNLVVDGGLSAW